MRTNPYLLLATALAFPLATATQAADAVIEPVAEAPVPDLAPVSDLSPYYVVGRLGGIATRDTEFGVLGTSVSTDQDLGFTGSAGLGAMMLQGEVFSLRVEAEVGFERFDVSSHTVTGLGTFGGDDAFGDATTLYGLANGYADARFGAFTPFIGAGIGYAGVEFDGYGVTPVGTALDDDGSGFAWQVGAGTAYDLSERTALELGYRYKGVEDVGVTAVDGTESEVDLRGHSITLGVRAKF